MWGNSYVSRKALPVTGFLFPQNTKTMDKENFKCEKCGGEYKKGSKASGQGCGCLFLILAFAILAIGAGTFGIVFLIIAFWYFGKMNYYWFCKNCGYKFERKKKFWE